MNEFNLLMRNMAIVTFFLGWLSGTVLAKGFWLTTLSVFLPFYSWYLVVEKMMIGLGWV